MNRRRFLSMLGLLPVAIVFRLEEPVQKASTRIRITGVRSEDLGADLKYANYLIGELGPEILIPPQKGSAKPADKQ